mgnify:FL=1
MICFFESLLNFIKFTQIKKKDREFVFYSESKFYRDHFIDLILNLKKLGNNNLIFITSDKEDYNYFKDILTCFYIKNFFLLVVFFKVLECKFLIMTLAGLGNPFQKSKLCKYYVYFFHAIASTHQFYTKSAFDNYDIIFANGEYQSKELKFVENKYDLPKKEIINTGYFYLDNIKKKANLNNKEKKHILFAPSWNYNRQNLFDDYSIDIINLLLSNNFVLTLRPHPEHFKRSISIIKKIEKLFSNNKNFILDSSLSNLKSLEKSEILITDNSSIVFEFMLIFKRPIIYIDYKGKIHNKESENITIKTIDEEFKNIFGNVLNISKIKNLPALCESLINDNTVSNEKVSLFFEKYLSNLNKSANFASNYLINKSKDN